MCLQQVRLADVFWETIFHKKSLPEKIEEAFWKCMVNIS